MLKVGSDDIRVSCVMPGSAAAEVNGPGAHEDEIWKLIGAEIA